jgi:UDP-N-acetylmuramyl pentapeptide phosphotransferase/UDP-N-acetylglucosamine-1-phosphate transferase
MGDTGSLIIGLILAILAINFVELSFASPPFAFPFRSSPAMAIAILIIPLFDTLRIFIVRVLQKKSPFKADRNHMHHVLLDLGLSHRGVSLSLYGVNILFIMVALVLRDISSLILLLVLVMMAVVFSLTPFIIKSITKAKPVDVKVF